MANLLVIMNAQKNFSSITAYIPSLGFHAIVALCATRMCIGCIQTQPERQQQYFRRAGHVAEQKTLVYDMLSLGVKHKDGGIAFAESSTEFITRQTNEGQ